jgi:urea transporter
MVKTYVKPIVSIVVMIALLILVKQGEVQSLTALYWICGWFLIDCSAAIFK